MVVLESVVGHDLPEGVIDELRREAVVVLGGPPSALRVALEGAPRRRSWCGRRGGVLRPAVVEADDAVVPAVGAGVRQVRVLGVPAVAGATPVAQLLQVQLREYQIQYSLSYTSLSWKSPSFVRPMGTVSSRILCMALCGGLFSLVHPSQFYVQIF